MYSAVLQCMTTAITILAKRTALHALHAVLHPDQVNDFFIECEKQGRSLNADANNCKRMQHSKQARLLLSLLDELRAPLVRIDTRVEALFARSELAEQCTILQRVSDVACASNHHTATEERTEGTAQWILQHATLREWRTLSASMVLWLHGIRTSIKLLAPCCPLLQLI